MVFQAEATSELKPPNFHIHAHRILPNLQQRTVGDLGRDQMTVTVNQHNNALMFTVAINIQEAALEVYGKCL